MANILLSNFCDLPLFSSIQILVRHYIRLEKKILNPEDPVSDISIDEIHTWQSQCHSTFQLVVKAKHAEKFFAGKQSSPSQGILLSALAESVESNAAFKKQELGHLKANQKAMEDAFQGPLVSHQAFSVKTSLGKEITTTTRQKRKSTSVSTRPLKRFRKASGKILFMLATSTLTNH